MKYRKKPVVIDAVQWFKDGDHPAVTQFEGGKGWVDTLEGGHVVTPGDWIITGVKGEHYPCKPDIFEMTYEPETLAELPAQQERNFCQRCGKRLGTNDWDVHTCTPPANANAGKQWVGLTDAEIREVGHLNVEGKRMLPYSFARAIEAKLREKNNG